MLRAAIKKLIGITIVLFIISLSGGQRALAANGNIYYVSPQGNDAGSGALDDPWQTIQFADTQLQPGDTLFVRDGTYTGPFDLQSAGNATSPITFAAYPNEQPLLTNPADSSEDDAVSLYGSYVIVDHLQITNQRPQGQVVAIDSAANHITISNSELFGGSGQGIIVSGNNNYVKNNLIHDNGIHADQDHGVYVEGGYNLIQGNQIYNNWANGIQLYNGYPGSHPGHNTVTGNYIYHNGYGAIGLDANAGVAGITIGAGSSYNTIEGNRICANAQYGVALWNKSPGNSITHTVTCFNQQGGFHLEEPGTGTIFKNNISYNDQQEAFFGAPGVTSNYNVYWSTAGAPHFLWNWNNYSSLSSFVKATGQDTKSIVQNPLFSQVPTTNFDSSQAATYNFCTPFDAELCNWRSYAIDLTRPQFCFLRSCTTSIKRPYFSGCSLKTILFSSLFNSLSTLLLPLIHLNE